MSSDSTLTFAGITRAIFGRLRKKAAQNGIPVSSQAGEGVKDGVTIQWRYDPGAEVLQVECVRAPYWINKTRINSRLSEEIRAALDSCSAP